MTSSLRVVFLSGLTALLLGHAATPAFPQTPANSQANQQRRPRVDMLTLPRPIEKIHVG